MKAVLLTLALVGTAALAQAQDPVKALQWPSGEGRCTGYVRYSLYQSCSAITANGKDVNLGACTEAKRTPVTAGCPNELAPVKREFPSGEFQAPTAVSRAFKSCDGQCDDSLCRAKLDKVSREQGLTGNDRIEFIGGSLGEKTRIDEPGEDGKMGRKTQVCTYNVTRAKLVTKEVMEPQPSACKTQVTFAQACRHELCGVDSKKYSYIGYGLEISEVVKNVGSKLVAGTAECASCDGVPALPENGQIDSAWLEGKANCLLTASQRFQKLVSENRTEDNIKANTAITASLTRVMDLVSQRQELKLAPETLEKIKALLNTAKTETEEAQ